MSIELTIFTQTYNTLVWSRCEIKIGRTTIEMATLSGFDTEKTDTDMGQVDSVIGDLRLRASDEPDDEIPIGQVLSIRQYSKTEWRPARVSGRFVQGDITRLTLEAVNE